MSVTDKIVAALLSAEKLKSKDDGNGGIEKYLKKVAKLIKRKQENATKAIQQECEHGNESSYAVPS